MTSKKEYIEHELLKSKLKDMEATSPDKVYQTAMEDMLYYFIPKLIDNIPTADVVEVTRCKDCKYYKNEDTAEYGTCEFLSERKHVRWEDDYDVHMRPSDFCSWGKRKEKEDG